MEKTVLITGAANGLGKALAEEFATRGWQVFAADIAAVTSSNPSILPIHMDVTDEASIEKAYTYIAQKTNRLGLLINNAGIFDAYPVSEIPFEKLYPIYAVNAFGPFRIIQGFLLLLLPSKGRIISISSESVRFPSLFQPYQASKIAMEAIHRTISQELFMKGIRMSMIRCGAMKTRMTEQVSHLTNPVKDSMFENEFRQFARLAPRFTGKLRSPEKMARKIYRIAIRKHLRNVYRIHNNPLLSMMAYIPDRWMMRILKWMLSN